MTPFFVGWMGLPRGLGPFVAAVIGAIAAIDVVLAALVFSAQPPRHTGFWGDGEEAFEGVLVTRPYPLVRVPASAGHPARAILLADEWKFGLPLGPEFKDGQWVRVQGYAIRRRDVTVVQVDAKLQILSAGGGPAMPALRDRGTETLTGEIVDSKCWTGAMNPGDGKAHKGCGALCLLGGIPALFISRTAAGAMHWYVLADPKGDTLGEGIRDRVGEPLTLTGSVSDAADLHEFRVAASALAD